jgi:Uma2 family endonuclease
MSSAAAQNILPATLVERLATEEIFRVPASFASYLAFAEQCEYRVEYSNNRIVSMGSPTDTHEQICSNVSWVFNSLFSEEEPYRIYGSNLGTLIQATGAHYKPDTSILKEEPKYVLHKVGKRSIKSIVNLYGVVEVFSDGTMDYDWTEKLPNYKQCPSLEYMIFIHQHKPFVTVFTRIDGQNDWRSRDYRGMEDAFPFEGQTVELKKLYRNVIFLGIKEPGESR